MSFSTQAKDSLCRLQISKICCKKAELAGFLRMVGNIRLQSGGRGLVASTTVNSIARRYYKMVREVYDVPAKIVNYRSSKLQKKIVYSLEISPHDHVDDIITYMRQIPDSYNEDTSGTTIPFSDCCSRAYLRGAYLGTGSINDPEGDYHLEMVCQDRSHFDFISLLLAAYGIEGRLTIRKKQEIFYLKGSEQIVDFLNVIGAHNALLEFENVRVMKEMRNHVNRQMNCESANLDKTVNAAQTQVAAIRKLQDEGVFETLPDNLKEIAFLRLDNPEISLKELGELCDKPLGKSGVNHRLRRLVEMAEKNL